MKNMKRLGCLLLVVAMCLALGVSAFAAGSCSITIENAVSGSTYYAYKIFDATYDETTGAVSYTIKESDPWYSLITSTEGKAYFEVGNPDANGNCAVTKVSSADDSALIAWLQSCISVAEDGTATLKIDDETTVSLTADGSGAYQSGGTAIIRGLDSGYYFVSTTTGTTVSITTAAPDAVIIDKNNPPTIEKDIVSGLEVDDESLHGDTEAAGDNVKFEVTANVPLYTTDDSDVAGGYLITDYEITDNMSAGLAIQGLVVGLDYTTENVYDENTGVTTTHYYATNTLINSWISIDGDSSAVLSDIAYSIVLELIPDVDENGSLVLDENGSIQFSGFTLTYDTIPNKEELDGTTYGTAANIDTNYPANTVIVIDYTAHVTGEVSYDNINEIEMDWNYTTFINPNDPEYTGSDDDENDIYVLDLEITKVDGTNSDITLEGAEFSLSGSNLQDVVTSTYWVYNPLESLSAYNEAKSNGTELWFLLTDGTYTNVDPYDLDEEENAEALAQYVENEYASDPSYPAASGYTYVAYTRTESSSAGVQSGGSNKTITGITDGNGVLSFNGLTVGTWTLTEIVAPDGYNILAEPITIEIRVSSWQMDTTSGKIVPVWDVSVTNGSATVNSNGVISINVANNAGTELPSTGGIGTTIFYVVGAILVCGAVVLLVTKRRTNSKDSANA